MNSFYWGPVWPYPPPDTAPKWGCCAMPKRRTPGELLSGIDTVVVLMMENRTFDHYFGMLNRDASYPGPKTAGFLKGDEWNPSASGEKVTSYRLPSLTQADPPHSWDASHAQWNGGKNDGFVEQHEGHAEKEVMGYFTRDELPFSYWLADNFTLCDRWHASVLGCTFPNRAVLHAADAAGLKRNIPFTQPPTTIWDVLPTTGKTGKNYFAGAAALYSAMFVNKPASVDPTAGIDEFFEAAEKGTLPNFVMIDPDFAMNDDHPSHDVKLGQAFISSIYRALAASPQWPRCLFVITYDEHGGFFDHVAPPECDDADPDYRRLGFRVPALVIGPTVRAASVCSTTFEHSSVAATLRTRFGLPVLSPRMASSADLSACIDPALVDSPPKATREPAGCGDRLPETILAKEVIEGQPELAAMIARGEIPRNSIQGRSRDERFLSWLESARKLGAVEVR